MSDPTPPMTLPKNALTTNAPARSARRLYRSRIRPVLEETVVRRRMGSGQDRANLPDFLLIGAQKAGTTALFESLVSSGAVGRPLRKEVHYFDRSPRPELDWYAAHFWGDSALRWGEASPEYLDTPGVATLVATTLPDASIVISLRDPVARTISSYHHAVDFGHEKRTLAQAVEDEAALLDAGGWTSPRERSIFGYLDRSRYSTSLAAWFDVTEPERRLVVLAEEPAVALRTTGDFLGVAAGAPLAVRRANHRAYDPPSPALRGRIGDLLRDDAEATAGLLGWTDLPALWTMGR